MQKRGFEPDSNEEIIALNFNVFPAVRLENTVGWSAGGLTPWPHCSSSGCGLAISVLLHCTELPKAFKFIISIPIFHFEVPSYLKQLFFSFLFFSVCQRVAEIWFKSELEGNGQRQLKEINPPPQKKSDRWCPLGETFAAPAASDGNQMEEREK